MKYLVSLLGALALSLAACDKLPENGSLDGQWQMTRIDHLSADDTTQPIPTKTYWNFQLRLLMIYTPNYNHNGVTAYTTARFSIKGDSLFIHSTYVHTMNTDSLLSPGTTCLDAVGVHDNTERYAIQSLTDSRLVLHSKYHHLEFRKY